MEFRKAGFQVHIATEKGNAPECDNKMLTGMTQKLLVGNLVACCRNCVFMFQPQGATTEVVGLYQKMKQDLHDTKILSWTNPSFSLDSYDLVFLPGGHEKGVKQVIDSSEVHKLLIDYFPKTRKPSKKAVAAICHGVMVLSESLLPDGKCVIHDATTTALPGTMEQGIFWGTRAFLGDYYKTYGPSSDSVQTSVGASIM